jgi:hypothetical protein
VQIEFQNVVAGMQMNHKKSCESAKSSEMKGSDRRKLSADAKIILALKSKQPLNPREIAERVSINQSSVYRSLRLMVSHDLIKETPAGFALWFYSEESQWGKLQQKINAAGGEIAKIPVSISSYSGRDEETGWRLFEYHEKKYVTGIFVAKNALSLVEVAGPFGIFVRGDYDGWIFTPGTIRWKDRVFANNILYEVEDVADYLETDNRIGYRVGMLRQLTLSQEGSKTESSSTIDSEQAHVRTHLLANLNGDEVTKDNCVERALFCVIYNDPNYSILKEFNSAVDPVDGVIAVGTPKTTPLQGHNRGVYGYEEQVPLSIYTIDKADVTSKKLELKIESELRRVFDTVPIAGGRIGNFETCGRSKRNIGNAVLNIAEFLLKYKRGQI